MVSRLLAVGLALLGTAPLLAGVTQPESVRPLPQRTPAPALPSLYAGEDLFARHYNAEEHHWRIARSNLSRQAQAQISQQARVAEQAPAENAAAAPTFYEAAKPTFDFSRSPTDRRAQHSSRRSHRNR